MRKGRRVDTLLATSGNALVACIGTRLLHRAAARGRIAQPATVRRLPVESLQPAPHVQADGRPAGELTPSLPQLRRSAICIARRAQSHRGLRSLELVRAPRGEEGFERKRARGGGLCQAQRG